MNGYNFTERVRKVLAFARQEAAALGHGYVGTEHILLALIREGDGIAIVTIRNCAVDEDLLRAKVLELVSTPTSSERTGPDLPYTSRAKKVLEFAMAEARDLAHSYVGTEHLLLGLLREEKGIGARALHDAGITVERARDEIVRILGDTWPTGEEHPAPRTHVDNLMSTFERVVRRRPGERAEPPQPPDFLVTLPDEIRNILKEAFKFANDHGHTRVNVADLLEALIFSSREVAAAFASREIEPFELIAEIRSLVEGK